MKFRFESESDIFEEFTMELLMDEKGRKVINLPFQQLKRNKKWMESDEKPYLPPQEDQIIPESELNKPAEIDPEENKLFLGVESDDEENPESKKQKLHFGGLNLKKKAPEPVDKVDYTVNDEYDTW